MKTLLTYYSFSGNTDKVARIFAEILRSRGEVDMQRLKPKEEVTAFFAQCKAAFTGKRADLEGAVNFDVSHHDILVLGTPVWAFAPVPSINTYLDHLTGLAGKKAIVFVTSGSGAGVGRCLGHIRHILRSKGASDVFEINIPDRKLGDETFVRESLGKAL